MKRLLYLFWIIPLLVAYAASGARCLQEKVRSIPDQQFKPFALFSPKINLEQEQYLRNYCKQFDLIQINTNTLRALLAQKPQAIIISLPLNGQWKEFKLVRNEKIGTETVFTTKNETGEEPYSYNDGVFYHGLISNDPQSVVALSFFSQNVMGFFSTNDGNFTVGQSNLWQPVENEFVVFNDRDALFEMPFQCDARKNPFKTNKDMVTTETLTSKCVKFYVECDNKIYTDFSSNLTNATNYATGLLNNTITLYLNDSIQTAVNQLTIWTSPDPYLPATNTGELLDSFASAMSGGFNGDLAHLMSRRSLGGGVAYLDILCLNIPYYQTGISASLSTTITPLPTYSWNSTVITHEIGHNMASPHTHACEWNGNGTRIDNCAGNYNVAYQEGTCNSFPPNPVGGGTIMSYCHLQPVGINLSLGFGPQPGTLIRNTVNAGACLGVCDTCANNITISGNYNTGYTESNTWIKTSGQTRIDSLTAVTLDVSSSGYILLQALTSTDYVLSNPQSNSAFFLAGPIDGCNGVSGKGPHEQTDIQFNDIEKNVQVFPNPTQNQWQIICANAQIESLSVRLFSMDGRMVWQNILYSPFVVSAVSLPPGLYQMQIATHTWQETLKVIKQ